MTTTSWQRDAACRGADPDTFHPPADDRAEAAKAICARCPVREPCLEHALAHGEGEGVWGGTTARERRRLLRERRRTG